MRGYVRLGSGTCREDAHADAGLVCEAWSFAADQISRGGCRVCARAAGSFASAGGAGARLHAQGIHMGGATRAEETTRNGTTLNTPFPSVLVHEKTSFLI